MRICTGSFGVDQEGLLLGRRLMVLVDFHRLSSVSELLVHLVLLVQDQSLEVILLIDFIGEKDCKCVRKFVSI